VYLKLFSYVDLYVVLCVVFIPKKRKSFLFFNEKPSKQKICLYITRITAFGGSGFARTNYKVKIATQFFQPIIAALFCTALFGYQKLNTKDWDYKAWFRQCAKIITK